MRTLRETYRRHRLLVLYALLNVAGAAVVVFAAARGWVGLLLEADSTGLVRLIAAVFAVGAVWCGLRIREVDEMLAGRRPVRTATPTRLRARNAPVHWLNGTLVLLGLVGTVIGFAVALSGIDPDAAADVSAVGPMIARLTEGMAIALHTTLVGAVAHLWLGAGLRLLERGTADVVAVCEELDRVARAA